MMKVQQVGRKGGINRLLEIEERVSVGVPRHRAEDSARSLRTKEGCLSVAMRYTGGGETFKPEG